MKPWLLIGAVLLCSQAQAQAQSIYKCKDANGRTLTSDRPIPECADRSMQLMGKDGIVRSEIPAPLTLEQKRQLQEQQDKKKADAILAAEQARIDLAISTRFRTEADIELAKTRAALPLQEQIKREGAGLAEAEKNLKDLEKGMAALPKDKPVPMPVKRRLDEAAATVASRTKSLHAREEDLVQVNAKFAQTLKRFRELNPK